MLRPLAETLLELTGAMRPPEEVGSPLRVTALSIDLPIEVRLRPRGDEWEFLADLPQWRWQTGMEELRGRLRLRWEEV